VAHDYFQPHEAKILLEYVWGRCKKCGMQVGETRAFENDDGVPVLKKTISDFDRVPDTKSYGKGCKLFEEHLKHCVF
jgi:hypothetical protein